MQDKCPKCGEPLITKTIKKELGLGSIDYPIALECPKCHWSKDLTGAGDIVPKPEAPTRIKKEEVIIPPSPPKAAPPKPQPKPEPSSGINKLITIALAILVLGGIVWAFFLYPITSEQVGTPKPTATPEITQTPVQPTSTPVPEVTPTGKKIRMLLESQRGFSPKQLTTKPGDEIVWRNDGTITVTLVGNDGLFDDQLLAYDKEYRYIFKKPGTYSFNLKGKNLNGTITVEP